MAGLTDTEVMKRRIAAIDRQRSIAHEAENLRISIRVREPVAVTKPGFGGLIGRLSSQWQSMRAEDVDTRWKPLTHAATDALYEGLYHARDEALRQAAHLEEHLNDPITEQDRRA